MKVFGVGKVGCVENQRCEKSNQVHAYQFPILIYEQTQDGKDENPKRPKLKYEFA